MPITEPRLVYKPFEYLPAESYRKLQKQADWVESEISVESDVLDFRMRLTDRERNLIGNVLKGFAQTEVVVNDYWATLVCKWFPKPEIKGMAVTFASMEATHAAAYSLLNETLGLDNFSAFLEDEATSAKIASLVDLKDVEITPENLPAIAKSLAVFSAFTEGVNLFSSFAILMSFQLRNLMKGVGQIVAFSVRDESLHSKAGCWLYNTLIAENPEINTTELRESIYEAARLTMKLEFDFIDKAFEMGDIEKLSNAGMKNFIKHRTNLKLQELGLDAICYDVDLQAVEDMSWFDMLTSGKEHQDFFAQRVTTYSKGHVDFSSTFDDDVF